MGISRISMYVAFGNKEDLFRWALERYTEGPAEYGARALQERTARQVATAFLNGSVRASTRPDRPAGCLGVQGCLAAGATAPNPREALIAWRNGGASRLRERFQQAVDKATTLGYRSRSACALHHDRVERDRRPNRRRHHPQRPAAGSRRGPEKLAARLTRLRGVLNRRFESAACLPIESSRAFATLRRQRSSLRKASTSVRAILPSPTV